MCKLLKGVKNYLSLESKPCVCDVICDTQDLCDYINEKRITLKLKVFLMKSARKEMTIYLYLHYLNDPPL